MYLDFYRLREYPFALTPDTDYWFDTTSHRDAMNVVSAALRTGEGFIKVTAEIGLGKTLLCRKLLRELENDFQTAYIPDPQLSPSGLRRALAEELGISTPANLAGDKVLALVRTRLLQLARRQTRVVVLIDEAHELPRETLEALRLLTNLETEKSKLLQVVVLGQPELDRRLACRGLRQLQQRIGFSCTLAPMSADVARAYIAHRLTVAGGDGSVRFDDAAVRRIVKAGRGAPRLINILCHKALMAAFGRGERCITTAHVDRAVRDTESAAANSGPVAALRAWIGGAPARARRLHALGGASR